MKTVITAARLWNGGEFISDPLIEIEDGKISWLGAISEREVPSNAVHHDYRGATLSPAFFDVHIHGAAGHDVMEATPQSLSAVSHFLATRGTGSFLATTVTAPLDATLRSLEGIAGLIEKSAPQEWPGAQPLGIHLEGPFLSHAKRGVHPPEHLLAPEIATFDRMWQASSGHIRLMTLAPELPGAADLAAHATALGVRVSVGHSNATAAETAHTIAAGATSATHTFNAMRALNHREPGILGAVLSTDPLYAELICDGIHVDPSLVKVWWRAKGQDRGILITDGMAATGMPEGEYLLGGFPVQVANGKATANGVLAGSVLTLDRAVANFMAYTDAPIEAVLPLVTSNPAGMTGFPQASNPLSAGAAATFVVLDRSGKLLHSISNGKVLQPA